MNPDDFDFLRKKVLSFVLVYAFTFCVVFSTFIYGFYTYVLKDQIEEILGKNLEKNAVCLADNIYYESVGESRRGQLAVATITLNRLANPKFAKTLCGVVYERKTTCEFSWVCQNKLSDARFADKNWRDIYKMSRQILTGNRNTLPELENALYYHAVYTKPFWANHKKRVMKIGAHVFYE